MAVFKIVIGTKQGKCVQKELSEEQSRLLLGKKIGQSLAGDGIGFNGYEFLITGGSDNCGFPMRKDIDGAGRKRILAVKAIGLKKKSKGIRQRKTVCGNMINPKTAQINIKVTKEGSEKLVEETGEKKKEQAEEKKK